MKIMNLRTNRMRCAALALAAFAVGTTPMWAQTAQDAPASQGDQGGPPHHGNMQEHRLEHMTKALSLSTDQVTQIKAIDQESRTQMMAMHQDTTTPEADKHAKMKELHEAQTAKVRAVLTDDQKTKFDAMLAKEHERMEHHRDNEDGPPAPPPAN